MKFLAPLLMMMFSLTLTAEEVDEPHLTVSLQVPDTTWSIQIRGVFELEEEIWVVAELFQKPNAMGAMMITTVTDSIPLTLPDLPQKTFVIGKTWKWENEEEVSFVEGWNALSPKLEGVTRLYPTPMY